MGINLGGIGQAIVRGAPILQQELARRKLTDEQEMDRLLKRNAQIQATNQGMVDASQRYEANAANIAHTQASTKVLQSPPEKATDYEIIDTDQGKVRVPRQGAPGVIAGPDGQPLRAPVPRTLPVQQQHLVDPVTGEVKFFDPTKPPVGLKVNPVPKAPPQEPLVQVQGEDGMVTYVPRSQAAGKQVPGKGKPTATNLPAPLAAKVGQAGEMIKKAGDVLPMIEGMTVSLGQSAAADVAGHGIGIGGLRIPGTKGLGNAMLNKTPSYAQYQAALQPFILAAAHALSGARINQDQVEQIRKSIEIGPGDVSNPQVVEQKRKNMLDLINSIAGSLPSDAIAAQEAQMEAPLLDRLTGYGYRRATGRNALAPAGRGNAPAGAAGNVDLRQHPIVSKYGITPPTEDDDQ